jgi:N-acetylmuramoyl-L-alanine amidase/FlgD Ig-like domain
MRTLRIAVFLLLAAPAVARAGDATIVSRDLPVGASRTTAAASAPVRFDLVGFHWQGSGRVLFRTRSVTGRWSGWRPVAPEAEDQPDAGSVEGRGRRGWRLGSPYWVGPSDRVDYRLVGDVRRLRAWYVWSPVSHTPVRTAAMAGSPQIVSRSSWGANEEILRAAPRYAKTVSFGVVHHTAGTNAYRPTNSAAIVRGIELYHVRGNGWNDIGYNFLVDRYGQVFEGRAGGIDRNVIGAHAQGFNTGSVGVAVIGNYSASAISPAAERALARLLAWRLDVAHVDPLGALNWTSGGNPKYPRGTPVHLRAISGHRDTGFTSCPGARLYARISELAREVAAIGLPKLYTPVVRGSLGGDTRFTARLSAAGPWTVTVRSTTGRTVARGTGTGSAVSWTWSSAGVAPGRYTWTIEAGAETRPAQGTIVSSAPLPPPPPPVALVSGLTLAPSVLSSDGDGIADSTTISYSVGAKSSVTATVTDASGAVVATLLAGQLQSARRQSFSYGADGLVDGRYVLTISASGQDGRTGAATATFSVDRTLAGLALSTPVLSPNGDGSGDTVDIGFALAAPAQVTVQVEQGGTVVATVFSGLLPAGPASVSWDGSTPLGPAPDGPYEAAVIVQGPFGETRHALPFMIQR